MQGKREQAAIHMILPFPLGFCCISQEKTEETQLNLCLLSYLMFKLRSHVL